MMRVYLASRYSRHAEMRDCAAALCGIGHVVTSRWIDGGHQISEADLSDVDSAALRERFAVEDWTDLMSAACVVSFTEPPRSINSRGGRHVEFGMAYALGKRCMVVGWRENVFHCLPGVEFYVTWAEAIDALKASASPQPPITSGDSPKSPEGLV